MSKPKLVWERLGLENGQILYRKDTVDGVTYLDFIRPDVEADIGRTWVLAALGELRRRISKKRASHLYRTIDGAEFDAFEAMLKSGEWHL